MSKIIFSYGNKTIEKDMNDIKTEKYVVRKTEVIASYIVIDGAKNYQDAENIFDAMLESGQEIEFIDDEVLTSECEVLSEYESENYTAASGRYGSGI